VNVIYLEGIWNSHHNQRGELEDESESEESESSSEAVSSPVESLTV